MPFTIAAKILHIRMYLEKNDFRFLWRKFLNSINVKRISEYTERNHMFWDGKQFNK